MSSLRVPFFWKTKGGAEHIEPKDMATKHVFRTLVMLWNHNMPPEMRTTGFILHPELDTFGEDYIKEAIVELSREFATRKDIDPDMLVTLEAINSNMIAASTVTMKFDSCSCCKDDQTCIKTGFHFSKDGYSWSGDLFMCKTEKRLSIHGINPAPMPPQTGKTISLFDGNLGEDTNGHYCSRRGGRITLIKSDIDYVQQHDNLKPYEVP